MSSNEHLTAIKKRAGVWRTFFAPFAQNDNLWYTESFLDGKDAGELYADFNAIIEHAEALAAELADAHAQITAWQGEAADHEAAINSLTVELMETKARIALIAPLVNAAIEMYLWEGATDYPNGDPEVEKRRQAFYSAVHDLWDLHDDELDFLEGASAPDATERTHERV